MHPGADLCLGVLGVLLQVESGVAVVELEGKRYLVGTSDLVVDGGGVAPEALHRLGVREEAGRDGKGGAQDVGLAELTGGGHRCHHAELVHGELTWLELLFLPNEARRREGAAGRQDSSSSSPYYYYCYYCYYYYYYYCSSSYYYYYCYSYSSYYYCCYYSSTTTYLLLL